MAVNMSQYLQYVEAVVLTFPDLLIHLSFLNPLGSTPHNKQIIVTLEFHISNEETFEMPVSRYNNLARRLEKLVHKLTSHGFPYKFTGSDELKDDILKGYLAFPVSEAIVRPMFLGQFQEIPIQTGDHLKCTAELVDMHSLDKMLPHSMARLEISRDETQLTVYEPRHYLSAVYIITGRKSGAIP